MYRRVGGAPGSVWTSAENLASAGIRSRTVQPVASRYTGPHSESDAEWTVLRKLPEKRCIWTTQSSNGRRFEKTGLQNACKWDTEETARTSPEIPLSLLILWTHIPPSVTDLPVLPVALLSNWLHEMTVLGLLQLHNNTALYSAIILSWPLTYVRR